MFPSWSLSALTSCFVIFCKRRQAQNSVSLQIKQLDCCKSPGNPESKEGRHCLSVWVVCLWCPSTIVSVLLSVLTQKPLRSQLGVGAWLWTCLLLRYLPSPMYAFQITLQSGLSHSEEHGRQSVLQVSPTPRSFSKDVLLCAAFSPCTDPAQHTAACHLTRLQAIAERAVPRFAFDSLGGVWRRVSCWPDSDD